MTSTSSSPSRTLQHAWSTQWTTPPPASCATLVDFKTGVLNYGSTCVYDDEDGPTGLPPLNTACLPWLTPGASLPTAAFYSPATACPSSWSAVATQTSGSDEWIDGETGISCCPDGFEDAGKGECKPASTVSIAVVQCGEDEEDQEVRTYAGGTFPVSVRVSVPALQIRYQTSDLESPSATGSGSTASSTSTSASSNPGGLSTSAKAAIGTVVPLVVILGALAAFLLWRRRKNKKKAAMQTDAFADKGDPDPDANSGSLEVNSSSATGPAIAAKSERPEWNTELDATEPERPREQVMTAAGVNSKATELGGMERVPRKPIPAVELDGSPMPREMDVSQYMAYQPPREGAA